MNFMADPLAGIEQLIGPAVTDFPSTPDTYSPANRPQDIRYEFPERGAESHGVNDDAPTDTYFPNQTSGDVQIITDDGSRNIYVGEELIAPDPVAVFEVPNPLRSIRKYTTFLPLFDGGARWSGTAFGGVDLSTVVPISADENRVRISFLVSQSYTAAANQVVGAWFAVSTDPGFSNYVIIQYPATLNQPFVPFTSENCKEQWYVALLPVLAYDSTKTLACTLTAIQEYAAPIDHNPVQAD